MPPTKPKTNDIILPISNHDFFKNHHCPMSDGNVRCRNISMCSRVHFGDHAAPQKAVNLRDQLVQQIKPFASGISKPDSPIWAGIESKVVKLMGWVLCQKHLLHREAMVRMTMEFLKEESGSFDEEQSAQPQSKAPAYDSIPSSVTLGAPAPYSTYASVASHLATPPMSPVTFTQPQAYQSPVGIGAGNLYHREASLFSQHGPPQHSPRVYRMDQPIKTEPETTAHLAQSYQQHPVAPAYTFGQQQMRATTQSAKSQKVPFGFSVVTPSKSGRVSDKLSPQQPGSKPIKTKPSSGVPHPTREEAPKTQATKAQVPDGFRVRERVEQHAPALQLSQVKTANERTLTTGKHRGPSAAADQIAPSQQPRSEMDQMVDNLEAMELRNKKLESNNQKLEANNEKLENEKQRLKAKYHAADDRVGDLEDEVEDLQARLEGADEKITRLEEELATLRR